MSGNTNAKGFSGEWIELLALTRFSGGENGQPKTAKGVRLSKNSGNVFLQAHEGDTRITVKLSKAELAELTFVLIKECLI